MGGPLSGLMFLLCTQRGLITHISAGIFASVFEMIKNQSKFSPQLFFSNGNPVS